nr:hypothetical protein [Tanacetum cinerariifolium]
HVSRKGASYFLIFTDDFSLYGYVYLLKHKLEVFKSEVELQLGKKIKALRSDRGDEYLSQEFKDYLKSAVRILNMVPAKKVWGCEAYVKRDSADKLHQRSVKCIFVEYPKETMGYYFYFPPENKVIVARDLGEPANYKAAMLDPDKVIWQSAIDEEINSMKVMKVWIIVDLPPNAKVVRSKWLYKKKTDMD